MWIARDKDGSLWLFEDKPMRENNMWVGDDTRNFGFVKINTEAIGFFGFSLLSEVTWENSPKELIIKPEESEGEMIDKELE